MGRVPGVSDRPGFFFSLEMRLFLTAPLRTGKDKRGLGIPSAEGSSSMRQARVLARR